MSAPFRNPGFAPTHNPEPAPPTWIEFRRPGASYLYGISGFALLLAVLVVAGSRSGNDLYTLASLTIAGALLVGAVGCFAVARMHYSRIHAGRPYAVSTEHDYLGTCPHCHAGPEEPCI